MGMFGVSPFLAFVFVHVCWLPACQISWGRRWLFPEGGIVGFVVRPMAASSVSHEKVRQKASATSGLRG